MNKFAHNFKDLTTQKIGKLTIIKRIGFSQRYRTPIWECLCDCGNTIKKTSVDLKDCNKSCGCVKRVNIDLTNQRVGLLKVIEEAGRNKHGSILWKCICDCGNEKILPATKLFLKRTNSCGCLLRKRGSQNRFWRGFEEISQTYFKSIIEGAKIRQIEFNITIEYLWDLFLKQNRRCALSGVQLIFSMSRKLGETTASLDRINSDKGYIEDNVQWVHKDVNWMKQDMTDERFVMWCKIIASKIK